MEHIGCEYIVILNDSRLRDGLIARVKQSGQSSEKARASVRLRFGLARALCALGSRIEPRAPHGGETGRRHPVFAD